MIAIAIGPQNTVGAIGITGAREVRSGVARGVVVQLAALHSPAELVMATLTFVSVVFVGLNALVDLFYAVLDPRVRLST